jgi:hypothetical protein
VQAPPQQEAAVTRESKAPARSEAAPRGEVRAPRSSRAEEPRVRDENRAPVNRVPERADRAVERPVRIPDAPAATPAPASAAASTDDDQGRPRGSVRRPPSGGRADNGRPIDRAIPRSQAPAPPRTTIVRNYPRYYPNYSRYYDPWGFGSFGIGYFYYSPWTWAPYANYGYGYGYGGYYPPYPGPYGFDIGSIRIKVKPQDAEVWVDGYYAGSVDDFDGIFQALKLDMGAYRIEVRKPGFETLTFDVRVQPERTITFRGEMRPIP